MDVQTLADVGLPAPDAPIHKAGSESTQTGDRPEETVDDLGTDKGWAWVILASAFSIYFVVLGTIVSFNVYIPIWMDHFEASAATTGLVLSVNKLVRGFLSPVASALCTKFGSRKMIIVGGVIAVGGNIISSQCSSVVLLILSNATITALGVSIVFVSTMHMLGVYFKKRYTLALGLALAGINIGQMAFPPLLTFLIDLYDWQGSILVTAAINMHVIAAGALMRPIAIKTGKNKDKKSQGTASPNCNSNDVQPARTENGTNLADEVNKGDTARREERKAECPCNHQQINSTDVSVTKDISPNDSCEPVHVDDGLDQLKAADVEVDSDNGSCWKRFKHFVLDTYGIRRLVHNTPYVLMMVNIFSCNMGNGAFVYMVARAKSVGIDFNLSALLMTMIGVGGLTGRISMGWFIDKKYIGEDAAYVLSLLTLCVSVFVTPFFVVFGPLSVVAVLMGASMASASSLSMVVVRSLVHPADATGAFGVQLIFAFTGGVLGNLLAGLIYDNTKSYDIAFFTGGGILLFAAILAAVLYISKEAKRGHHPFSRFRAWMQRKFKSMPTETGVVNPVYELNASIVNGNLNPGENTNTFQDSLAHQKDSTVNTDVENTLAVM